MEQFNEAIISIRPRFAEAILSGMKSIELRRRIPLLEDHTRLWIYATLPVGAIVGSATVARIIRGSPADVWKKTRNLAAIDRVAYDTYFNGAQQAVGLVLSNVNRINPVPMAELRRIRAGFQPPQVIARISATEAKSICDFSTNIQGVRLRRSSKN